MERRDFSGKQVGRYLFVSQLGSGTGGSVYQAVDITMQNSPTYAIKCMQESNKPRRYNQQLAEIKNHDRVALCPHVLTLYDFFEKDDYFFLVLPLCEMDMATAIFEEKIYWKNDSLIKRAFIEILDGVFACHKKGVFHRDLKPENIMCNAEGTRIQVGDFGLSTNRRFCRDGPCGTIPYMSPECVDDMEFCYDANLVDIWGLGVILFNMVTHCFPWQEASRTDRNYMAFLCKKNSFFRMFQISESLGVLLRQIWHPIPMKRMSIPAIRQAIVEIDTFYEPQSSYVASPLVLIDSEQTCCTPIGDKKAKDLYDPIDALEEAFRRAEMMMQ